MSHQFDLTSDQLHRYITENIYRVRIPYLQSRHPEDIKKHGVVLSGVPSIDKDIINQWVTVMIPVKTMLDYHKNFVPIKIPDPEDVKQIYDNVQNYIFAWRNKLQYSINNGVAPIEDLILMDEFANKIYNHAKYEYNTEALNSLAVNELTRAMPINANNIFKTQPNQGFVTINAIEEIPERDSLSEFFKNRILPRR